jgi:hypothetical protein
MMAAKRMVSVMKRRYWYVIRENMFLILDVDGEEMNVVELS